MNLFPSTTTVLLLECFAILALLGTARPDRRWRLGVGTSAVAAIAWLTFILESEHDFPTANGYFFFERGFFFGFQPFVAWICACAPILAILCLALRRWVWAAVVTISFLPWLALYIYKVSIHSIFESLWDFAVWAAIALVAASITTAISLRTAGFRIRITRD